MQSYGSIAGSESLVLGFDPDTLQVKTVMAEAPHATFTDAVIEQVSRKLAGK